MGGSMEAFIYCNFNLTELVEGTKDNNIVFFCPEGETLILKF